MVSIWHDPKYNTWLLRTSLKALSGILFALALCGPLLGYSGRILFWPTEFSLMYAAWGLIVFTMYYSFERERRKSDPDWVI
ncbi:MAG: hypothetical protein ACFFD6_10495 [Candidatus Thorarchaeota archaeon]